jgi:hypothetical protein
VLLMLGTGFPFHHVLPNRDAKNIRLNQVALAAR